MILKTFSGVAKVEGPEGLNKSIPFKLESLGLENLLLLCKRI